LAVTLTGVWNQLAILGFPTLAFVLLTASGASGASGAALQTVAALGLAAFVVVAGSFAAAIASAGMARKGGDRAARIPDRLLRAVRRGPVTWDGSSLVRFRAGALGLLQRRWPVLTVTTLAGQLSVFLVLLASLRALDVGPGEVSLIEAFAAWSLARVIG